MSSSVNIIEIWDKSKYEKTIDDSKSDFAQLAEEVMGDDETNYHTPVLLKESIDALIIDPNGVYIDVTFGGEDTARSLKAFK